MLKRCLMAALALFWLSAGAHAACDLTVGGTPPLSGPQLIINIDEELACLDAAIAAGVSDGDKGDITVSSSGAVWSIDAGLDAAIIGGGSVSTAEFDRLDGITAFGQSIIDDANEAAFKATVNLEIGTDVQAFDADLTTWAGLTPSADVQSLVTAANYAAMRSLLGLVIGTNVQAYDADLTTYAGITPSANVQSLLGAANYAAMRGLLDLEAGTDFNAYSARLNDIAAGITWNQGDILYFNGSNLVDLGPGTSGQFLKTQGAGANPVWADAPGAGSGATVFTELGDVPTDYTGHGGEFVKVTAGEDGLEFVAGGGGGGSMDDFTLAGDGGTPQTIADGNTLTIAGSTGVSTAAGATDTLTITLDSDLQSWSGVTRASGFDTFTATPSSANLRSLLTDETGTGAAYFAGGNAGTPSAIDLTNGTALPISGLTGSTSTAIGVGSVELGHASDTTIARSGAGVITVEGVEVTTNSGTQTLINKSIAATQITAGALNIGNNAATVGTVEMANGTSNTLSATGGNLSIEGNVVYRAGGTNVAIADGGCNADDAATCFANIKQAASETATGVVEMATTAEAEAGTDTSRAVTPAGVLAAVTGKKPIWIPGGSLIPRTTNGCAITDVELPTNDIMIRPCAYDATTEEGAGFTIRMPDTWNEGTLTVVPVWTHPSTTTNFGVVWGFSCLATSNDDAMDAALGSQVTSTDTGGTTSDQYTGPATSAMTCSGSPQAGDTIYIEAERLPANGSDTMAVDAYLLGFTVYYTDDAFVEP